MKLLMNKIWILSIFLIVLSCGDDSQNHDEDVNQLEWNIGKNVYQYDVDGEMRDFIVYIPASYTGEVPVPVVFMLHGSSGTGEKFYNISRWREKSDEAGFIAVFPTALEYFIVDKNRFSTKWSSASTLDDVAEGTVLKDDKIFFDFMLDILGASLRVDDARIYACGFSNGGGFIKSELMPNMSDRFAAFATSGGIGIPEVIDIDHDQKPPLFNIVGTRDENVVAHQDVIEEVPLDGQELMDHEAYGVQVRNMLQVLELSDQFSQEPNPPQYNLLTFSSSTGDSQNEYKLMLVNDMGHNFPNEINNPHSVIAVDIIWPWFMKYSL